MSMIIKKKEKKDQNWLRREKGKIWSSFERTNCFDDNLWVSLSFWIDIDALNMLRNSMRFISRRRRTKFACQSNSSSVVMIISLLNESLFNLNLINIKADNKEKNQHDDSVWLAFNETTSSFLLRKQKEQILRESRSKFFDFGILFDE